MSEAQNAKSQNPRTPPNVIANAARFNRQFLDSQLDSNPSTVSIGRLLHLKKYFLGFSVSP